MAGCGSCATKEKEKENMAYLRNSLSVWLSIVLMSNLEREQKG
jgi:hypothetical protein